jgi:hypothetical protein
MANLKPEQYWLWRHKIEEMQHAETKLRNKQLTFALMEKDIEIQKHKAIIYKEQIKNAEEKLKTFKEEYEQIKKDLEQSLGMSLNNTSIDDITFEVKMLD